MSGHEASKLSALCAAALLLGCGGDSPTAPSTNGGLHEKPVKLEAADEPRRA